MEDETLGFFKKTSSSHARLNVPALVQVAALAIIMIRGPVSYTRLDVYKRQVFIRYAGRNL